MLVLSFVPLFRGKGNLYRRRLDPLWNIRRRLLASRIWPRPILVVAPRLTA